MTEVDNMMIHDDETGDGPRYASLTAGLLARKGEAVPAAAAFTAEAIAQHIPARRLAQEAERILTHKPDEMPELESQVTAKEQEGIQREQEAIQEFVEDAPRPDSAPQSPDFLEQHEQIEEAFGAEAFDDVSQAAPGDPTAAAEQDPFSSLEAVAREPLDLPDRSQPFAFAQKPSAGSDQDAFSPPQSEADAEEQDDSQLELSLEEQQEREAKPIADLEESDENWFEDIVSKAIHEADDLREGVPPLAQEAQQGASAAHEASVTTFPHQAKQAALRGTSVGPMPTQASGGSCSNKVQDVRNAIRSGNPKAAARSAMKLDPRRFIRLSLASRKLDLSNQELMMAALDAFMDTLDEEVFSECSCMKKGLI